MQLFILFLTGFSVVFNVVISGLLLLLLLFTLIILYLFLFRRLL